MPLVEVTLAEGRTPEQLRSLLSAVTAAVSESVSAPKESIRVVIREVPPTHWAAGDVTLAEKRAAQAGADPSADRHTPSAPELTTDSTRQEPTQRDSTRQEPTQ